MPIILINGLSAKAAGGRSILKNLLGSLAARRGDQTWLVLVPELGTFAAYQTAHIRLIALPRMLSRSSMLPVVNSLVLPGLVQRYGCSAVLNLADIPIPSRVQQVLLFDWPYAVYPDSPVWGRMGFRERMPRRLKLRLFRRYLDYVDVTIAQSTVMEARLRSLYQLADVRVVPNAVSLEHERSQHPRDFRLGPGLKLLCLSRYYVHKNIEVFIPLADEIVKRGLPVRIITTIAPEQGRQAAKFLRQVSHDGLQDVIINIGPVDMADVPSLYEQTDGLLLPTLLESFSGTYVEAMYHGKPILTSDYDFARAVCGTAAYYFDPFDPIDIVNKIVECRDDGEGRERRIAEGRALVAAMPSWIDVARMIVNIVNEVTE